MLKQGRRTSVVWSFEEESLTKEYLENIKGTDIDAIRVAFRPENIASALEIVGSLKGLNSEQSFPVIVDIFKNPRAVFRCAESEIELKFEDSFKILKSDKSQRIFLETEDWDSLFVPGATVYCGSEAILNTVSVTNDAVVLEVLQGGTCYDQTELYVPKTQAGPTFEDIPDQAWLVAENPHVDYIVLPSFESAEDIKKVIDRIQQGEYAPWLLLKIGSEKTYENLAELLPYVRGALLSRIELAMHMDPAKIPMLTKEVIQLCKDHTKISLVASDMLGSMRHNATPTRAEVSDIGNAVLDGADAVVLSDVLAKGKYAKRGLELAQKTVMDIESSAANMRLNWQKVQPEIKDEIHAVTFAAYRAAFRNAAKAIVCITKMGNTAIHLSSFDIETPIIAISLSEDVVRRLKLVRGVDGVCIDELPSVDQVLPLINSMLVQDSWLSSGDKYVFVSVTHSSISVAESNLFTIQTVD